MLYSHETIESEEVIAVKKNRLVRLIAGLVLLAVFAVVLALSIKNYDYDKLMQDAQPKTVVVTVEVTVTPDTAAAVAGTDQPGEQDPASTPAVDPDSPAGLAAARGLPEPPAVDVSGWEFLLANPSTSISTYVPPQLETLEGQQFDSRIIEPMKAFIKGARDEGLSVYLSSGYRSYNDQEANFRRVCELNGVPDGKDAKGFYITLPAGNSEHQSGLCCDITDIYYSVKNRSLEDTALYKWMSVHCQEYGFIVRYPDGKEAVTEIMYEPWHFRYVGSEAAVYIMDNGLTLEEFLDLYKN